MIDAPSEDKILVAITGAGSPAGLGETLAIRHSLELIDETALPLLDAQANRYRIPDARTINDMVDVLTSDNDVIAAQPNYLYNLQGDAKSEAAEAAVAGLQYAAEKLNLRQAHRSSTGQSVTIAIIDTAADLTHPEFSQANAISIPIPGTDNRPQKHGTAIAGIIGAGKTLLGVSPNARLIAIQAFDTNQDGIPFSTSVMIADALNEAATRGARIFNMSFAGPRDPLLIEIVSVLGSRDTVMIAAAGNNGPGAPPVYPAAHPAVIAITASDEIDLLFSQANHGDYIDLTAPGVSIIVPAPGQKYDMPSGTSMAAAHVTGVVALLLERNPTLTASEIRDLLINTASDVGVKGPDNDFGAGLVNPVKAISQSGSGN